MRRFLTRKDMWTFTERMSAAENSILTQASSISLLSERMTTQEAVGAWNASNISSLQSRMNDAEAGLSGHNSRIGSLETWRANKSPAIADVSLQASVSVVNILGIEVPTGSSFTAMVNLANSLKATVNSILAAQRAREMILT